MGYKKECGKKKKKKEYLKDDYTDGLERYSSQLEQEVSKLRAKTFSTKGTCIPLNRFPM